MANPDLTVFEKQEVAVNTAFTTVYEQTLHCINHALYEGVPVSREQATTFKHAMLILVREVAHLDAAMPQLVEGWETGGLELALKV